MLQFLVLSVFFIFVLVLVSSLMLIYGVGPFFLLVACAQRFAQNQKPNTFPENIKYMHNRLPDSIVNWDSQTTKFTNGRTDVQARIRQKRRAKFSLILFTERRHVGRELG